MGQVKVVLEGSFRYPVAKIFSAMDSGHADAIAQAIQWLAQSALPDAIAQDHKLQAENAVPRHGFGRWLLDRPLTTARVERNDLMAKIERLTSERLRILDVVRMQAPEHVITKVEAVLTEGCTIQHKETGDGHEGTRN